MFKTNVSLYVAGLHWLWNPGKNPGLLYVVDSLWQASWILPVDLLLSVHFTGNHSLHFRYKWYNGRKGRVKHWQANTLKKVLEKYIEFCCYFSIQNCTLQVSLSLWAGLNAVKMHATYWSTKEGPELCRAQIYFYKNAVVI